MMQRLATAILAGSVIGIVVYFTYSMRHSKLAQPPAAPRYTGFRHKEALHQGHAPKKRD